MSSSSSSSRRTPAFVSGLLVGVVVGLGGCADTTNPSVEREPAWDSPRTRALAERACFDCHSHQTRWPWYASVPLVGWWLQDHVDEGRAHLNFSTWSKPGREADEAAETIEEGEMPLASYLWLHGEAKLGADDTAALVAGLKATFAKDPPRRAAGSAGAAPHDHD
jgi:hypothetical protein